MTYTAVDVHGNNLSASFEVVITDDENPVISGLTADIALGSDSGDCGAVVTWKRAHVV